ncbi:MAG: hypothetical protein IH993_08175 [Proteobacteria bacterium]|nr:hypothetical protein [Pseudomonadota bacterium]
MFERLFFALLLAIALPAQAVEIKDDLGQKHNLAATMPDKARKLHTKLIAWRKAVAAPMPTPKPRRN